MALGSTQQMQVTLYPAPVGAENSSPYRLYVGGVLAFAPPL